MILAMFTQSYRFTLLPGGQVVPWASLTLRPEGGIPAVVTRRERGLRLKPFSRRSIDYG
jgi:hypothetical protein